MKKKVGRIFYGIKHNNQPYLYNSRPFYILYGNTSQLQAVEANAKQAHKRVDLIKGRKPKEE